jgi:hypothetical protein
MTEIQVTPELTEAVGWLKGIADGHKVVEGGLHAYSYAHSILAALPEGVTNPKPPRPTKPGYYLNRRGSLLELDDEGEWTYGGGGLADPDLSMPLTRLVPEKPPVTGDDLHQVYMRGPTSSIASWRHLADYINNR